MNKTRLLLILSTLLLGLITFSSCSKENTLNDLQGKTFVPKEKIKDSKANMELFFESGTNLIIRVKDVDLPEDLLEVDKTIVDLIKNTKVLDMDFSLAYTYDKITREIKLTKTDQTLSEAGSKLKGLIPLVINEKMKDKSDLEKAIAIKLIEKEVDKEVGKEFDKILASIKSMIYIEEANEVILRVKKEEAKEAEDIIFKEKD